MFSKDDKRGILIGIVSSAIFLVFIQPAMRIAWHFLISYTPLVLESYVDKFYKTASLGNRSLLDVMFFGFMLSMSFGTSTGVFFSGRLRKKFEKIENEYREEVISEFKNKMFRLKKQLDRFIGFSCVILCVLVFHILLLTYANLQLNTSFKQRLTILSPKITLQQERELCALWASMKSKSDYIEVNRQLEGAAEKAGIQLPVPLF